MSSSGKLPDPEIDPIYAVFYVIFNEDYHENEPSSAANGGYQVGAFAIRDELNVYKMGMSGKSCW